jgi:hypothetical protein
MQETTSYSVSICTSNVPNALQQSVRCVGPFAGDVGLIPATSGRFRPTTTTGRYLSQRLRLYASEVCIIVGRTDGYTTQARAERINRAGSASGLHHCRGSHDAGKVSDCTQ